MPAKGQTGDLFDIVMSGIPEGIHWAGSVYG